MALLEAHWHGVWMCASLLVQVPECRIEMGRTDNEILQARPKQADPSRLGLNVQIKVYDPTLIDDALPNYQAAKKITCRILCPIAITPNFDSNLPDSCF